MATNRTVEDRKAGLGIEQAAPPACGSRTGRRLLEKLVRLGVRFDIGHPEVYIERNEGAYRMNRAAGGRGRYPTWRFGTVGQKTTTIPVIRAAWQDEPVRGMGSYLPLKELAKLPVDDLRVSRDDSHYLTIGTRYSFGH